MDFRLGERSELFRQEARDFLDEVFTDEMREEMHRTGVHHSWTSTAASPSGAGWLRAGRSSSADRVAIRWRCWPSWRSSIAPAPRPTRWAPP